MACVVICIALFAGHVIGKGSAEERTTPARSAFEAYAEKDATNMHVLEKDAAVHARSHWQSRGLEGHCRACGHHNWPRFSGDDCVKQMRYPQETCIPCKKTLPDGTKVNRFAGPCKRDATVLASQVFVPGHFCNDDGSCNQGRLPRFRGNVCWAFNKGKFTRWNGPAGVCIKEGGPRYMPTVEYALSNMAGRKGGLSWINEADFIAAYQWSMETRKSFGDDPKIVMTCAKFCQGQTACGEVGDCSCGEDCKSLGTAAPAATTATTTLATTSEVAAFCANKYEVCSCVGKVYYGAKYISCSSGTTRSFASMLEAGFKVRNVNGSVPCTIEAMGGDPHHGCTKWCYCESAATTTPAPPAISQDFCACPCFILLLSTLATIVMLH